jgi:endoglucanase
MKYLHVNNSRCLGTILARKTYCFFVALCCCLWSIQSLATTLDCQPSWPAWQNFKLVFINEGGRVVDGNSPRKQTVSEAQAYALFFALIANDRNTFDKVLQWTENNLAEGDLTSHLPAWLWGRKDNGAWEVLDKNSASDADLWMVYGLGEAGRLWKEPRYIALSSLLAKRILREETANLPNLGITLLPAPHGFQTGKKTWRLNPSYLPMQILNWLSDKNVDPAWQRISESSMRILLESAPQGFSPEWTVYEGGKGFRVDGEGKEKGVGDYNAIRVYLWAGMLAPDAPARPQLLAKFAPMVNYIALHGYPPESVNTLTGEANKPGPPGFSMAMLPMLAAIDNSDVLQSQLDRLTAHPPQADAYYEQVLSLFGKGWHDGYYHFAKNGNLLPQWLEPCNANLPN